MGWLILPIAMMGLRRSIGDGFTVISAWRVGVKEPNLRFGCGMNHQKLDSFWCSFILSADHYAFLNDFDKMGRSER